MVRVMSTPLHDVDKDQVVLRPSGMLLWKVLRLAVLRLRIIITLNDQRPMTSQIHIIMRPELLVRPIGCPRLEVTSIYLKTHGLLPFLFERHLQPEHRMLLRHSLYLILLRDDIKRELGIPHHNSLQPNPARTSTPHDLNKRTMVVGRDEQRTCRVAVDVCTTSCDAEYLANVAAPKGVEGLVDGVFALRFWDVEDAEGALLFGVQRLWLVALSRGFRLLMPVVLAFGAGIQCRVWCGWAQEEGSLLDLFAENGGSVVGGMRALQDMLRYVGSVWL